MVNRKFACEMKPFEIIESKETNHQKEAFTTERIETFHIFCKSRSEAPEPL